MKAKIQKNKKDLENRLARALADYQNLVKRAEKEKSEMVLRANRSLIEDLLVVLDMLERAQKHLQDNGLGMALAKFRQILENNGVERIEAEEGLMFNETLHEAMDVIIGGERGVIVEVLEEGYKWKDGVVLRPAKVRVYGRDTDKDKDTDTDTGTEREMTA